MKKMVILLIVAMAFMMVGCFGDGDTELGWKNDNGADGKAIGDITWSEEFGGSPDLDWGIETVAGTQTSSLKTPTVLAGYFECTVEETPGGGFVTANIQVGSDPNSENITLDEGSTNVFTVTAQVSK